MPEYVSEDLSPYKSLPVHFATKEDMEAFSQLVGQPVAKTSRSIWYPQAEIGHTSDKRYVDEGAPVPPATAPPQVRGLAGDTLPTPVPAPVALTPPAPIVLRPLVTFLEADGAPIAEPKPAPFIAPIKSTAPAVAPMTFLADVELP